MKKTHIIDLTNKLFIYKFGSSEIDSTFSPQSEFLSLGLYQLFCKKALI